MPRKKFPSDRRPWFKIMIGFTADTEELTDREFRAFCCCIDYAAENRATETNDTITVTRSRITSLAPNARTSLVTSLKTLESLSGKMLWRMTINRREFRRAHRHHTATEPPTDRQLTASAPPVQGDTAARRRRAESEDVASVTICIRNWSKYQGSSPSHLRGSSVETPSQLRSDSVEAPPLKIVDLDSEREESPPPPMRTESEPESESAAERSRENPLAENLAAVLASGPDAANKIKSILDGANAGQRPATTGPKSSADELGEIVDRLPVQLGCKAERWESLRPLILADVASLSPERLQAACETFTSDSKREFVPNGAEILAADRKLQRTVLEATRERAHDDKLTPIAARLRGLRNWLKGTKRSPHDLLNAFKDCSASTLLAALQTIKPDSDASNEEETDRIRSAIGALILERHNAKKPSAARKIKRGPMSKRDVDKWIESDATMATDV